ncbi:MAG: DUF4380 domain-containing protein [Planctomycetota bacterium]|nr:DUF4380 domain-containing protein [Planctomycetota bacterium]
MTKRYLLAVVLVLGALMGELGMAAEARQSSYRGWRTLELRNGLVDLQVVPDIGGRIVQLTLDGFEYLWVNEQLAGKLPPPNGLGPDGSWLNYGGSKLWPAPQGWDRDDRWPGPPDAILDGSPHSGASTDENVRWAGVKLVSQKDPRTGIQFTRRIKVCDDAARVSIDCEMKNIDTKNRRWGIWQVSQHTMANRSGEGFDKNIRVYIPVNPKSAHAQGYTVLFGRKDNPEFQADGKMMRVHYEHHVGKLAMDCSAGWLALVNGTAGCVFVERFTWEPGKPYPDDASVEIWTQGKGSIVAWGKETPMSDNVAENPYVLETELLSPFAELKPGETSAFHVDWYAARIGGDYPVLDATDTGVTCEAFKAVVAGGKLSLNGRFGVFYKGEAAVVFLDGQDKEIAQGRKTVEVSPKEPLVLHKAKELADGVKVPPNAAKVCLVILDKSGTRLGTLATAAIEK